jgi:hypothetical protein
MTATSSRRRTLRVWLVLAGAAIAGGAFFLCAAPPDEREILRVVPTAVGIPDYELTARSAQERDAMVALAYCWGAFGSRTPRLVTIRGWSVAVELQSGAALPARDAGGILLASKSLRVHAVGVREGPSGWECAIESAVETYGIRMTPVGAAAKLWSAVGRCFEGSSGSAREGHTDGR